MQFQTAGLVNCWGVPQVPRYQSPPPNAHRAWLLLTGGLWDILHVVSYLRFWFHSHGLRCWSSVEFSVQCCPRNCPVKPPMAKGSCTKSVCVNLSKRVMICPFRAFLMRSSLVYHIHQYTDRVSPFANQYHDIGAASSANPYLMSEVSTSEVLYRYYFTLSSYENAA